MQRIIISVDLALMLDNSLKWVWFAGIIWNCADLWVDLQVPLLVGFYPVVFKAIYFRKFWFSHIYFIKYLFTMQKFKEVNFFFSLSTPVDLLIHIIPVSLGAMGHSDHWCPTFSVNVIWRTPWGGHFTDKMPFTSSGPTSNGKI